MKQLIISFQFLLFFFTAFSQSNKIYFNADGKYVRDPQKASYYIIVEKIQDTVYSGRQYDMYNHIQVKGTYKDESLTIPIGKFYYYENYISFKKTQSSLQADTSVILKSSGYFLNGLKIGSWAQFYRNGKKETFSVYENNKLNGVFQQFDKDGNIIISGKYLNDK